MKTATLKALVYVLAGAFLLCSTPVMDAETVRERIKREKAEIEKKSRQEFERAWDNVRNSSDPKAMAAFVARYPGTSQAKELRSRLSSMETRMWNSCDAMSRRDMEAYLQTYPRGQFVSQANVNLGKIARKEQEEQAERARREEAGRKAAALRADALKAAHANPSAKAFGDICINYPGTAEAAEAGKFQSWEEGLDAYKAKSYARAMQKFDAYPGAEENRRYAEACNGLQEHRDYARLSSTSSASALQGFLDKYPRSVYRSKVASYRACQLADDFSYSSTESDYNRALQIAPDASTRLYVNNRINANKAAVRENNRRIAADERRRKRENHGGWVQMALGVADVTYTSYDENCEAGFPIGVRFGNFGDFLNFEVGLTPGYSTAYEGVTLPVYGQVKLRLFKINNFYDDLRCCVFLWGRYSYHTVTWDWDGNQQWNAGLGFGWKHIDLLVGYGQREYEDYYNGSWNDGSVKVWEGQWTFGFRTYFKLG